MERKLIIKLMAKEIKALRKEIESRRAENTSVVTANKILSEENVKLRNIIEQINANNQRLSNELNDVRKIKAHDCPAIRQDIRNMIENQISILNHLKKDNNLPRHGEGQLSMCERILELAGGKK